MLIERIVETVPLAILFGAVFIVVEVVMFGVVYATELAFGFTLTDWPLIAVTVAPAFLVANLSIRIAHARAKNKSN